MFTSENGLLGLLESGSDVGIVDAQRRDWHYERLAEKYVNIFRKEDAPLDAQKGVKAILGSGYARTRGH